MVHKTVVSLVRPLLLLAGALSAVLLGATLIYMWGMATLEDSPRSFLEALEWSAETLTSTGYGAVCGGVSSGLTAGHLPRPRRMFLSYGAMRDSSFTATQVYQ